MIDTPSLPKNPDKLVAAIRQHVAREETRLCYWRTKLLLAWYYLQGVRKFTVFNENTGQVLGTYTDDDGNLELQTQELAAMCNEVAGRIASIDIRPLVRRTNLSLEAIRSRANGQIILNSVVPEDHARDQHRAFSWLFATLGSAGLSGEVLDHPTIGLCAGVEVVHPLELMPFPSLGQDTTRQRGILRNRMVPLSWLKEKLDRRFTDSLISKMDVYERSYGEEMSINSTSQGGRTVIINGRPGGGGTPDSPDTTMMGARIEETWLYGDRGTCSRYILTSGEAVLQDIDLRDREVYPSLVHGRFMENGTFHGMGVFDMVFPYARAHERLLKSLFNNAHDIDRYGLVVLPSSQMNSKAVLQDIGKGLKAVLWEPDAMTEGFRPFAMSPATGGDMPGKVAAYTKQLMREINPVQDLLKEKGRVDSAQGLQFLDEQINRALTNPTSGVQAVYSGLYRSIAQQAIRALTMEPRTLPVTELTIDLLGAVIDPETNDVSFKENPIPGLSRLSFGVRDLSPRSEVALKQEAMNMAAMKMKMGMPDWDGFVLYALQKGLDFAMWADEDRAAYESVVRNILLLYGDGENPGQIIVTPETSKPQLQLRVLGAVMGDTRMALASPAVVDAFKAYRDTLLSYSGMVLPAAVPNPDDLAMLGGNPNPQPAQAGLPPGGRGMMA